MVEREIAVWSYEEIAAAFAAATRLDAADDAMTVRELAAALGHGEVWVRQRLRVLLDRGEWECVRVPKLSMAGTMVRTLAYRPRQVVGAQ